MSGHYKALKLSQSATPAQIASAHKALAQEWEMAHPAPREQDLVELAEINEAGRVLSDPALRQAYDAQLASAGSEEQLALLTPARESAPASRPGESGQESSGKAPMMICAAVLATIAAGFFVMNSASVETRGPKSAPAPSAATMAAPAKSASEASVSASAASAPSASGISSSAPALTPVAKSDLSPKEKEAKEKEAKEKEKEKEAKEKVLKEKEAKEKDVKEKEAKEKLAKEKEAKEKEAKEKDQKARELKEKEAKEKLAKEKEDPKGQSKAKEEAKPAAAAKSEASAASASASAAAASHEPKTLLANVACPGQVTPSLPKGSVASLTAGVVRAKVLVSNGAIKEVKFVSGPRMYYASVQSAISRYSCAAGQGEVVFYQDFHFDPSDM